VRSDTRGRRAGGSTAAREPKNRGCEREGTRRRCNVVPETTGDGNGPFEREPERWRGTGENATLRDRHRCWYIAEKSVNMGHRWRCKCGYTERSVGVFGALFEYPAKHGTTGGKGATEWVTRGRGLTIRWLLRRGRDRWNRERGDCLRLEVSTLAVLRSAPLLFFFSLSLSLSFYAEELFYSFALARTATFYLVLSHFRILSSPSPFPNAFKVSRVPTAFSSNIYQGRIAGVKRHIRESRNRKRIFECAATTLTSAYAHRCLKFNLHISSEIRCVYPGHLEII